MLADPRRRDCQVAVEKNGSASRAYVIVSVHDLVRFPIHDEHDKSQVNILRLRYKVI